MTLSLLFMFLGVPEVVFLTLGKIAGAATAVASAAGLFNKFVIQPVRTFLKQWAEHNAKVDKLTEKLGVISAEFYPNGGATLRDAVNALQKQMHFLDQQTKMILTQEDAGVFISNEHGDCLWANKAYLSLTGRALQQVQGKGWKTCIYGPQRERVIEEWQAAVSDSREFDLHYSYEKPGGEEIPVHCVATRVMSADMKLVGYLGYVTKVAKPSKQIGKQG